MIALEEGHNISLAFRGSVPHLVGRDVLPEAYVGSGQSTRVSRPERYFWAVAFTSGRPAAHRASESAAVGFRQSEIATHNFVAAQYRAGFVSARKLPSATIFNFQKLGEIFRTLTSTSET